MNFAYFSGISCGRAGRISKSRLQQYNLGMGKEGWKGYGWRVWEVGGAGRHANSTQDKKKQSSFVTLFNFLFQLLGIFKGFFISHDLSPFIFYIIWTAIHDCCCLFLFSLFHSLCLLLLSVLFFCLLVFFSFLLFHCIFLWSIVLLIIGHQLVELLFFWWPAIALYMFAIWF